MITVNVNNPKSEKTTWYIEDLIGRNFYKERTAFVGSLGVYKHKLFLVTYDCIVLAEDFVTTWQDCSIDIQVDFWCDLEINAKRL